MSGAGSNVTTESTASNGSSPISWTSPGAGITSGYDGNSVTLKIFIVLLAGLAMYNAIELLFMCWMTFARHKGLYFWSLFWASVGIIPYSLGFLLKFMNITTGSVRWLAVFLLTIGWYPMITGQSLVLWSRLHLILSGERGEKIIRWTKWMIIIDAIILHIPTTVLTIGANSHTDTVVFETGYNIMEKIQMIGFFLQEVTLSSIYIVTTINILKMSLQPRTRRTMHQLIAINVVIIIMDLALLGLECASLYILETLCKGIVYSVKLKLEIVILSKLVKFVGGSKPAQNILQDPRRNSINFLTTNEKERRRSCEQDEDDVDVSDFVDLERVRTDVTHASIPTDSLQSKRRSTRAHPRGMDLDYDLARFQHVDDVSTLQPSDKERSERSDSSYDSFTTKTADWARNVP